MPNKYYGNMCFSEPYTDKEGQEKKNWHVFGKVFQGDRGGMSVYVPLLGKWFSIFKQEPRQNAGGQQQRSQGNQSNQGIPSNDEGDLPF